MHKFKTVVAGALVGSLASIMPILSPLSAKADDCYLGWNPLADDTIPECTNGLEITQGDKRLTFASYSGFGTPGTPNVGVGGILDFQQIGPEYIVITEFFQVNSNGQEITGSGPNFSADFGYDIDIIHASNVFGEVSLSGEGGGEFSATKSYTGFDDLFIDTTDIVNGPASGKSFTITDQVEVGLDSSIILITNRFTQVSAPVPGPFPILGASAAFGFSRKIRSRIKNTTLAATKS